MMYYAFALILLAVYAAVPGLPASTRLAAITTLTGADHTTQQPRDGPARPARGWPTHSPRMTQARSPNGVFTRLLTGSVGKVFSRTKQPSPLAVAADIELFAASVQSGLSVQQATSVVAELAADDTADLWRPLAALTTLGVSAERAWGQLPPCPGLSDLATLVVMSGQSGASIASGCQRIVDTLRADASAAATARAERAGVLISIPLAVCFLPAFIVLGLVPVLISLGLQLL